MKFRFFTIVLQMACGLFFFNGASSAVAANANCQKIVFHMDEFAIAPLPNLVNGARVRGDVKGDYTFTLASAAPSLASDIVFINGPSTISTKRGNINFYETGAVDTNSPGQLAVLMTVVGGSDAYANATGKLWLTGNFDAQVGGGQSVANG